jgi:hypothetical protein
MYSHFVSCSVHSNFGCTETPDGDAQRFCIHAVRPTLDPKLCHMKTPESFSHAFRLVSRHGVDTSLVDAGDIILWHPIRLSTLHPSLHTFGMNVVNILLQHSRSSVRASECVGAFIFCEKTYCVCL